MSVRAVFRRRSRLMGAVAAVAVAASFVVGIAAPAQAVNANQATLVSAVPSTITPNIDDGVVYAITQVGSWIVVGGSFTSVTPHGSTTSVSQSYLLAFDATTGALDTAFAPVLSGTVFSLEPGATPGTVFVGGQFLTVNGVQSKGITQLSLSTGAVVKGFSPAALNGIVYAMRLSGGHLFLTGSFTTAAKAAHGGLATISPTTGKIDPYLDVQLTGHHNYNGTGANGAIGGRAMDITPDGTRAIVVGDFKDADGAVHDQVVMLDLGASAAVVDPNWNTAAFTATCARNAFDTYVEDVDFSPDGSYFAIANTGGGSTNNTDGTHSLCDSASRWSTTDTGTDVQPTWVDFTGNDSFWTVAVTGTAIYLGGHERWVNNPNGVDHAGAGAVPRPGIVALDPTNGMPYSWNPGRNPRGAGAFALLATSQGLYVGSDTDWIGDTEYHRGKIAFFPLAGGEIVPPSGTAQLPADLYQAGPTNIGSPDALVYHSVNGSQIGAATTVANSVSWSTSRGAFMAGNEIFFGTSSGNFYEASYDGTTVGTPVAIDPYDDPTWQNVQTGSGQTYRGVKSGYYGELSGITGAFYSNGRLYYTQSNRSSLYWRYFEPESGIIGGAEFTVSGASFSNVAGMVLSGSTIYYANRFDGTLHTVPFVNGVPNGAADTTLSTPGVDWRARGLFLNATATAPANPVSFVVGADSDATTASPSVTVPAGVNDGDTELLYVSANTAGVTPTTLAGWTELTQLTNKTIETTVFERPASASDSGTAVSVPLTASAHVDLQFADYANVASATLPVTTAVDASTASHATPSIAVTANGSWVVSYWADRSSATTGWTLPASVTSRGIGIGAGGGRICTALADSGASVHTGVTSRLTATANSTSSLGNMISIVLAPVS